MLYRNLLANPPNMNWILLTTLPSYIKQITQGQSVSKPELDYGFLLPILQLCNKLITVFFMYMCILVLFICLSLSLTGSQYVSHGTCSQEMTFSWVLTLTSLVQKQFWHLSTKTEELGYKFKETKVHVLMRYDVWQTLLNSQKPFDQAME